MKTKSVAFLLLSFISIIVKAGPFSSLRNEIIHSIDKYDAKVGVAVMINDTDTLTVNNSDKYPMMSVFKFHQALAVCHLLQMKGIPLDSVINISRKELRENTYSPLRDRFPEGNIRISLSELMEYTLQLSDNNACDILFNRILSIKETDRYIRSLGIDDFSIEMDENDMHENLDNCYSNWTTPMAAVRLINLFLEGGAVSAEYYDFIKRTMTECTTGIGRLPYPLKNTAAVIGHKTGTGDKNSDGRYIGINDIGFIDLSNGDRYLIAVFVKDSAENYETTEKIIAEISSIVYKNISNQ
ncbi:class A beta-lactamase, subclass A2 [Bacteroides sp. ET336]|uniref:class A beta-lactamase, subclass A2 n=1 Tax=Bacteroides sp. ET336 TaxID=2972459 RepID=UPI0021ACAC22|nr:class A beta-lactamase, subclass A2 [Bacteroides sp. ET336]MCR8893405.1 class A beta-lactamase, subclass A2 [Bacteroides sp. ET336]MDN0057902.1 class A beta-lactamase, subclass A2 [Bacteroides caecigallinarum]